MMRLSSHDVAQTSLAIDNTVLADIVQLIGCSCVRPSSLPAQQPCAAALRRTARIPSATTATKPSETNDPSATHKTCTGVHTIESHKWATYVLFLAVSTADSNDKADHVDAYVLGCALAVGPARPESSGEFDTRAKPSRIFVEFR